MGSVQLIRASSAYPSLSATSVNQPKAATATTRTTAVAPVVKTEDPIQSARETGQLLVGIAIVMVVLSIMLTLGSIGLIAVSGLAMGIGLGVGLGGIIAGSIIGKIGCDKKKSDPLKLWPLLFFVSAPPKQKTTACITPALTEAKFLPANALQAPKLA